MAFIIPAPRVGLLGKPSPSQQTNSLHRRRPLVCTAGTSQQSKLPSPSSRLGVLLQSLTDIEQLTRPGVYSDLDRYEQLPQHVKTPSQMLGKLSPGCEGTKGVFPRCNFSCQPCYHSEHSNEVRVDGFHTVTEIARQMQTLQKLRGATAHCQLIGGEVSLLSPEDHILALETMRYFGRIPMSFTHGEFEYDYLHRLAVLPSGRPRFNRLDFAVHFDIDMRGRRGLSRLDEEGQLTPYRRRFIDMFRRLRREHGVRYYLAHNMTVQARNLPTLAPAVRDLVAMGFRLISFQPAALQGARRVETLRDAVDDEDGQKVWNEIERGVGIRLPFSLFQMGDVRCNRMAVCGLVGVDCNDGLPVHIFPLFDDQCRADEKARDLIMAHLGNIVLAPHLLAVKLLRTFLRRPWLLIPALAWVFRVIGRARGVWSILRRGIQPLTVVMHRFMDADDVSAAWKLMDEGVASADARVEAAGPRIRETMERLGSCSYAMAHADEGRVVPACVQHSVYDPVENVQLAELLPLKEPSRPAADANFEF